MSKSSIQFAGILFLLAAILAVSGQETTMASGNASLNNTTLLNNITQNATTSEPAIAEANESSTEAPALPVATDNETALNETAINETATNETVAAENMPVAVPEAARAENETTVAPTEATAPQNVTETAPALEAAPSENATPAIETVPIIPVAQPGGTMIGSVERTTFAVSGIGRSPNQFSIDGKSLSQGAYAVGLPARTIMDLSALPFFINKF
jgi:hypothetical protein